MSFAVAPIVEGHGDVSAIPILIRRMSPVLDVRKPVRFPRSRLVIDEHLCRAAAIAAANIPGEGAILLVIDADEDCAATLGPDLERRLALLAPQCRSRVVLAVREFEAWIVAGDSTYRVEQPDAAGSLKARIKAVHGEYRETADQPRLAARIDPVRAGALSRSFRRLQRVIDEFSAAADPDRPRS